MLFFAGGPRAINTAIKFLFVYRSENDDCENCAKIHILRLISLLLHEALNGKPQVTGKGLTRIFPNRPTRRYEMAVFRQAQISRKPRAHEQISRRREPCPDRRRRGVPVRKVLAFFDKSVRAGRRHPYQVFQQIRRQDDAVIYLFLAVRIVTAFTGVTVKQRTGDVRIM